MIIKVYGLYKSLYNENFMKLTLFHLKTTVTVQIGKTYIIMFYM